MVQTVLSEKKKKIEIQKIKKSRFQSYTRARTHVRAKNAVKGMFLCMYDAVECCKMSFEGIFRHVERTKLKNGIVVR